MTRDRFGALGALTGLLLVALAGGAAAGGSIAPAAQDAQAAPEGVITDPVAAALAYADTAVADPFSLLGGSRLDAAGLVAAYESSGHTARLTVPLEELAAIFIEEGAAYGVRADIAWAQSLVETGWLIYPDYGQVHWTDNNYAGIGAYDGGVHGFHYVDARTGVRAQMQLLRQYADAEPIDESLGEIVVRAPASKHGSAPSWRVMGNGNWATSTRYADTVLRVYLRMLDATGTSLEESTPTAPPAPPAQLRTGDGLWLAGVDGQVYDVGDTRFWGSAADKNRSGPVVAVAPTRSGDGYWLVTRDGDVFSYGDARRVSRSRARSAAPIAAAVSPRGRGLWLVGSGGGVVAVAGAPAVEPAPGSVASGARLVGIAATRSGRGYWLVDSAGRVVAVGDALDLGDVVRGQIDVGSDEGETDGATSGDAGPDDAQSVGVDVATADSAIALAGYPQDPVAGIAATRKGDGYWIVTAGGSVIPFGAAQGLGSLADALPEEAPSAGSGAPLMETTAPPGESTPPAAHLVVAIAPTRTDLGYWIVCSDGTVAGLGDAASLGDVTADGVPILAAAPRRNAPRAARRAADPAG